MCSIFWESYACLQRTWQHHYPETDHSKYSLRNRQNLRIRGHFDLLILCHSQFRQHHPLRYTSSSIPSKYQGLVNAFQRYDFTPYPFSEDESSIPQRTMLPPADGHLVWTSLCVTSGHMAYLLRFCPSLASKSLPRRCVEVVGLKHTRFHVVMGRILPFGMWSRQWCFATATNNATCFLRASLVWPTSTSNIGMPKGEIGLSLEVKESWYIYPAPIFELADRSFNVWWKEMNCDFDRVNYGIRIDHLNLTGRKDKFKIKFQQGYTRKYELNTTFLTSKAPGALEQSFHYAENKELGFITWAIRYCSGESPMNLLFCEDSVLVTATKGQCFCFHTLRMEYQYNSVDDVVVREWNPNYYPHGDNYIQFSGYCMFFLQPYHLPNLPEGGYAMAFEALADGLGLGNYNNLAEQPNLKPIPNRLRALS